MEKEIREADAEGTTRNEKLQEVDTVREYDDFFEVEQSLDSAEEKSDEEREWKEGKKSHIQDWEKEAKNKIRIEMDDPSMRRRRTIYDLNSYASSRPSVGDIWKFNTTQITTEPSKKIRYSASMGIPGIARLDLSALTQKIVGCIIGEDVTAEFPWVHVKKDIIEDNIDLHSESSDFLPVKDEVHAFPDEKVFIGYAPSLSEEGQFYIVLTEEGRDAIVKHIQEQREDHENRVRYAIYKSPGQWHDLGGGAEVDANVIKNTRPLFEIEVTSTADLLNVPVNLTDRKAADQRDGYVELLPDNRQIFENVRRKLVSRYTQVTPIVRHNEAQTAPSIPVNSWYQYLYEYETVDLSTYTEEKIESLKDFLERYTDEMCDQVLMNSTWDIYTNDYANLVRNEKDTQAPVPIGYKEHQSYYDGKIIADKVINDLSWHPFWTGTAVATYTQHAKSEHLIGPKTYDEVSLACEGNNRVLIWSFTDCLSPKLILECPREVTSVSIAIWHIPGKIEQVETVVAQTGAQVKYSIAMRSLMTWMRETTATSLISPTAMSALKYSQKAGITQIVWVPSHHKVDKNGRISSLSEDAPLDDLSCQFVTASEDGTIAFWDLKSRLAEKNIRQVRRRKRKIHPDIPKSKAQPASPFKILDRVLKPDYILVIQYPDESRQVVITTLSMYNPKFRKEQVEPFPVVRDDLTIRKYYKPIIEKTGCAMEPKMLIGTAEGDFGCITWTGYEFATDASVNRETARWIWMKRMHDGPVTHSVRSNYYHQVVLTVGGKIFAVWRDDFGEPLVWNKSNVGYSACSWGIIRPTVLILGRMDGTVEIWDLIVKSHEPSFVQSLSGRIITGVYTHELPLEPQCIGFCDFNGSLRTFTAPRVLLTYDVGDVEWMKKFIDRQVQRVRISEFQAWQETWREANLEDIEMKKELGKMEGEKKRLEAEEKIKADTVEAAARAATPTRAARRKPWQFLEEAKERWMSMEVKRMQRLILEKKGLRKDVLERQRAPVLRLRQEARTKKRKIREILNLQDRIFEETVVFLFPEQHRERRETLLPPLPVSAADRRLTIDEFIKKETAPRKEDVFADPEEEIIYNFLEVQAEALAKLKSTPFERTFDWRKVLAQGKSRRRSMDIELKKLNRPKKTCKVDGAVNDASRLVGNV
ncbi:PREDICTED: WD repeat-containing protein 63-like [Vollenhovia emeryi]|uniref:WD repeat-containing protein 63-like n=1 Tax=Vollenhovia emeryi TaxID=411798 RepID=UPI0005F49420|nr:PREDICTED: WD repeat-containing protein 63-like [Vollenhovia emeryi]